MNLPMKTRWLLTLALTALLPLGCSPSGPAPSTGSASSKKVVAFSVRSLTIPFFKVIGDSMADEAAKHGYEVLIVGSDFDEQNQVKDFIVKKVSAIVLCPCDSRTIIGPAIQEANAAGIPVFTANIGCLAPGAKVVCHIASDNYSGGKQAAVAMIEALGDAGGQIAIL